jgi:hypothetical protein
MLGVWLPPLVCLPFRAGNPCLRCLRGGFDCVLASFRNIAAAVVLGSVHVGFSSFVCCRPRKRTCIAWAAKAANMPAGVDMYGCCVSEPPRRCFSGSTTTGAGINCSVMRIIRTPWVTKPNSGLPNSVRSFPPPPNSALLRLLSVSVLEYDSLLCAMLLVNVAVVLTWTSAFLRAARVAASPPFAIPDAPCSPREVHAAAPPRRDVLQMGAGGRLQQSACTYAALRQREGA